MNRKRPSLKSLTILFSPGRMCEGGERLLIVPPKLGYGAEGLAPLVPPDSTLIYEVELVRIEYPGAPTQGAKPPRVEGEL